MTRHSPALDPAALAQARQDYENTPKPARAIAEALGITRPALFRLVVRENWKRRPRVAFGAAREPTAPSPARRPSDAAKAPLRPAASRPAATQRSGKPAAPKRGRRPPVPKAARGVAEDETPASPDVLREASPDALRAASPEALRAVSPEALRAKATARIARAIDRQLDLIDTILSETRAAPSPAAERTARTLASLTRTLKELAQLGAAAPQESDDDESPRDLAAFRKELAERLDRIVAEAAARPDDEDFG